MVEHELRDISIIGGGPTGLFAAFYAGMRGASARIIDALPALGGQLLALYPEKYIFDVAGFPKVLAKDLVRDMAAQGLQFGATTHLGEIVTGLRKVEDGNGGHFVLETSEADYPSRTIIIAAGIGAFEARKLGIEGEDRYEERDCTSRCSIPGSSPANGCSWWAGETQPLTGRSIFRVWPSRSC